MILSSHVAIGTAVGTVTGNPLAGFLIGFISHHLADMIPHTDAGSSEATVYNLLKNKKVLNQVLWDAAIAIIIFGFSFYKLGITWALLLSVVGALLPDVIDNSPFWSPYLRGKFPTNYYHKFHEYFHFTITNRRYFYLGYLTQFVIIAMSLYIVVK